MTKTLSKADLAQFTGGENWYRHAINRAVLFTDGAKYVWHANRRVAKGRFRPLRQSGPVLAEA
ncbi:MAG: DUF6876 family protein [Steroidobacteraceae bacterium]|jgi:uncharacterized protein DUF6876